MDPGPRHEGGEERRAWILSTLQGAGSVSISDLARRLDVSQMTVRRDLRLLEGAGEVRLFHGGVSVPPHRARGPVFPDDGDGEARRRVGSCAAGLIGPDDTIVIDAGPTAYALAEALPDDFAGCVITHSMPVLQLLDQRRSAVRTVALGGELLVDRHAFVGSISEAAVAGLRARTYFFSPCALDAAGAYARSSAEAALQRRLLDISDQVVLLATETTFTSWAASRVAALDGLTALVADQRPPSKVAGVLRQLGVVPYIVGQ